MDQLIQIMTHLKETAIIPHIQRKVRVQFKKLEVPNPQKEMLHVHIEDQAVYQLQTKKGPRNRYIIKVQKKKY